MKSFGPIRNGIKSVLFRATAVLTLSAGCAYAAPSISTVNGTISEQSTITVSGSGFGAGPNVILYDDFNGGSVGNPIPLGANVGSWTDVNGQTPIYAKTARSGTSSMRSYYGGKAAQLKKVFPSPATEVFLSYWVRIPDNTPFPGKDGGVKKFSSDSSWKMSWLIDSSYDGSSSDVCLPTHTGRGAFSLSGNDFSLAKLASGSNWWSWNSWMRVTVWLRANTSNTTGSGQYLWQVVSSEKGLQATKASAPVFDADGPSQKAYRYLNIPGWIRSDNASQPVYDDIYLSTGANAQARVEIGDAPTYAGSKHLALLIPDGWSSNSINARLPSASLPKSGAAYLYVTDKDGNVNAQGYPLKGGAVASTPNAPTNVSVQ